MQVTLSGEPSLSDLENEMLNLLLCFPCCRFVTYLFIPFRCAGFVFLSDSGIWMIWLSESVLVTAVALKYL